MVSVKHSPELASEMGRRKEITVTYFSVVYVFLNQSSTVYFYYSFSYTPLEYL
jgi:hypothetical protein